MSTHAPQATSPAASYELCYDPREATMIVYRSLRAGICGPCSDTVPCGSHADAERIAFNMGYLIASDWQSHTNYDSANLARMAS